MARRSFVKVYRFSTALILPAFFCGAAAHAADPAADAQWAGWRGPGGQGVATAKGLPVEWSETKNVAWKTPIPGRGHSSPVVWGDRIFLTTAIDGEVVPGAKAVRHMDEGKEFVHPEAIGADRKHKFEVIAIDARTGKIVWEKVAFEGTPYDSAHRRASFASPTAVTDGERVYAFFGSEGLYAYDFEGRLLWKAAMPGIANMGVGYGTSPVLHKGLLIVQCDEDSGEKSFIAAYHAKTGKEAWRVARKVQVSWATPVIVRAAEGDELVTAGTEWLIGYDPMTGKELWRSKGLESNAVPSPVAGKDVVVLTSGFPSKKAIAIRPGGTGDITGSDRVLWTYEKGTAYVPSPILYGDFLYLVTDKGLMTCLDVKTGAVRYEGARPPVAASFMASPVAFEDKILLASQDGDVFVIKAGPAHEVLRTNSLGEPISASPAIANGRIYIRGEKTLFAIGG
jgi:outer membrane protein assembly factor BamB